MSLTEDVQQKPLWFKLKKNKKQKQESLNYGQVFFCFVLFLHTLIGSATAFFEHSIRFEEMLGLHPTLIYRHTRLIP